MGGKVLDHEAKRIKQSGVEEGSLDTLATSLRNLMSNLSVSSDEAMKLLGVAESMKPKLKTML